MSYYMPGQGLGYTFHVDVFGTKQTIGIPLEQMTKDAVNEAWPVMKQHVYAELPALLDTAVVHLRPQVRVELNRVNRLADEKLDEATRRAAIGLGILLVGGATLATLVLVWPTLTKRA